MALTLNSIVKLPKSKKILILVGVLALLSGLYAYLVYLPTSGELDNKRKDMGKLETQLRELRTIAENMRRFQAEAAKLREELAVAVAQLPTSKEIPSLLANVSNLGKEAGLEFLLFRPTPEVGREFYAEIPVEIRVKGSYNAVAVFFDKVGKLPRIVNISSLTMEGAKEVSGRWEIATACTATTFKFIEKPASELTKDKKSEEKKGAPPSKK
ncbi:MAG: type 4a pilus biogenesis protein PilO [Deltaproteobacteria bacterium]|nr:type 4a pilus biogenesis protein PilO [Deltaproteobacteria bacterium]